MVERLGGYYALPYFKCKKIEDDSIAAYIYITNSVAFILQTNYTD
jgi:hypothetical protein